MLLSPRTSPRFTHSLVILTSCKVSSKDSLTTPKSMGWGIAKWKIPKFQYYALQIWLSVLTLATFFSLNPRMKHSTSENKHLHSVEKEPILTWHLSVEKFFLTYQISAFLPYPSPLITSGLIQYGVPVTDFIPVPERHIVCSRLLAPKSPSFTLPAESRRIFAPGRKGIQRYIHERPINILVWKTVAKVWIQWYNARSA